jgi:hypothetical protein
VRPHPRPRVPGLRGAGRKPRGRPNARKAGTWRPKRPGRPCCARSPSTATRRSAWSRSHGGKRVVQQLLPSKEAVLLEPGPGQAMHLLASPGRAYRRSVYALTRRRTARWRSGRVTSSGALARKDGHLVLLIARQVGWVDAPLGCALLYCQATYVGSAGVLMKWERDWERILLAAARWCSAVLAPARF